MPNPTPLPDWLYNVLQAPYNERQQAGQVVTPGPVDWGGMGQDIYTYLQQPYNDRVAREAQQNGLTTRQVSTVPVNPMTGMPVSTPSVSPAPPSTYKTITPLAGGAQLPAGYRPSVAFPSAPMPLVDGMQFDPITGRSAVTPQQVLANSRPSAPVIKSDGRPPAPQQMAADPSIPKLTPLDAPLPPQPYTKGGSTYFAPGGNYGYNAETGAYEVKQPGNAYVSIPAPNFANPVAPKSATPVVPPSLAAIEAAMPPLPRVRPNIFPSLNAPMVPSAGPKAGQPKSAPAQPHYAGMNNPPSLFPHADDGLLGQMNGLAQMGRSPFGGLLMALMAGGGSQQTARGPMLAMNGQPSNFPNPISGAPGANAGTSGAQSFDGSHFMSGNTPGAYYDPNNGWVVPGTPNVTSSGSALA